AGTFNNNVISMAAGVAGLTQLYTPEVAERLTRDGDAFRERLNALAAKRGLPIQILGIGSMLNIHFQGGKIERPQDVWPRDEAAAARLTELQKLMHFDLIDQGQYLARRGFITLSLPMTAEDFSRFEAAFDEFLAVRGSVLAAGA